MPGTSSSPGGRRIPSQWQHLQENTQMCRYSVAHLNDFNWSINFSSNRHTIPVVPDNWGGYKIVKTLTVFKKPCACKIFHISLYLSITHTHRGDAWNIKAAGASNKTLRCHKTLPSHHKAHGNPRLLQFCAICQRWKLLPIQIMHMTSKWNIFTNTSGTH